MATYTPNLNLKKPSTGEYYDVVGDNNDSKDKIDSFAGMSNFVFADRTGVISAASIINTLIANSLDGDIIRFPQGVYKIDAPIVWGKKVSLVAEGIVTFKASVPMESIITATGFTTYSDVSLDGFYLDADNKANHCIKIDGSQLYAVRTVVKNCECRHALLDGIIIIPPAWSIQILDTLSNSNGRDGIRAIMTSNPGANQLNHIKIDGCTCNDNVGDGINILGVINTVTNCDVENNLCGIRVDATQCPVYYASFLINIDQNYIEGNRLNQIYSKSLAGDGIVLNVKENYINSANLGGDIIKLEGATEGITLTTSGNRFETSVTNLVNINGGDCLTPRSSVSENIRNNESKYINLGFAKLLHDNFSFINLPPILSTGFTGNIVESADIVLLPSKTINYTVPIDMQHKMPIGIDFSIKTNAVNYQLTCKFEIVNKSNVIIDSGSIITTGVGNMNISEYITNIWGNKRLPKETVLRISFIVDTITADRYLTVSNVFIKYA